MARTRAPVRFKIDRGSNRTFYEQVRDQLINLAHFGTLAAGQRLPTVRQLARDGNINLKTAFKICRQLARAGLVEIRPQSGIFVRSGRSEVEQAYRRGVSQFLERVKKDAARLNLTPRRLSHLLALDTKPAPRAGPVDALRRAAPREGALSRAAAAGPRVTCAVLECNREQTRLFAAQIERNLGVRAVPLEVFAANPPARSTQTLREADFLVTTDFHWEEGLRVARRFRKKMLRVRLDPGFLEMILTSARQGPFTMILTDISFRQRLREGLAAYLRPEELDRIRLVHCADRAGIRKAVEVCGRVYVSPLCEEKVEPLLGDGVRRVRHDNMIAPDSLRELSENLWLYPLRRRKAVLSTQRR